MPDTPRYFVRRCILLADGVGYLRNPLRRKPWRPRSRRLGLEPTGAVPGVVDGATDVSAAAWHSRKVAVGRLAAGSYAHYSDVYQGERGSLTMDFWPLDYHLAAAQRQWVQSKPMLACFEHWFGPYPWYEDGYKLIEVSNNGMEHQSAVSYGNWFQNGYRKRDGSGTGLGL